MWNQIDTVGLAEMRELSFMAEQWEPLAACPGWIRGCFIPMAAYSCEHLWKKYKNLSIQKKAINKLGMALLERLCFLGKGVATNLLFDRERENRERFSADPREDIWIYMIKQGYGVLIKSYKEIAIILEESIQVFLKSNRFFLDALNRDWEELKELYKVPLTVTDIFQNMKELHKVDKNVHIVTFNEKYKIVFKQEKEGCHRFWQKLCANMNAFHIAELYCPWKKEKKGYEWQEYIDTLPASFKKPEEAFVHAGELLCLFYILNSTDMHKENILWRENIPVVIDFESICNGEETGAQESTVEKTFFLPGCHKHPYIKKDFSALGGKDGGNYVAYIQEGFARVYNTIKSNKRVQDFFEAYENVWFRYILHSTWLYANILERGIVRMVENGMEYNCCFEAYKNLFPFEKKSLSLGYLPVLLQKYDSRDLYDESGQMIIKDFFKYSPKEAIQNRLRNMSDENLKEQLEIIKDCFLGEERNNLQP